MARLRFGLFALSSVIECGIEPGLKKLPNVLWELRYTLLQREVYAKILYADGRSEHSPFYGQKAEQLMKFAIFYTQGSAWVQGKSIYEQPVDDHDQWALNLFNAKKLLFQALSNSHQTF